MLCAGTQLHLHARCNPNTLMEMIRLAYLGFVIVTISANRKSSPVDLKTLLNCHQQANQAPQYNQLTRPQTGAIEKTWRHCTPCRIQSHFPLHARKEKRTLIRLSLPTLARAGKRKMKSDAKKGQKKRNNDTFQWRWPCSNTCSNKKATSKPLVNCDTAAAHTTQFFMRWTLCRHNGGQSFDLALNPLVRHDPKTLSTT